MPIKFKAEKQLWNKINGVTALILLIILFIPDYVYANELIKVVGVLISILFFSVLVAACFSMFVKMILLKNIEQNRKNLPTATFVGVMITEAILLTVVLFTIYQFIDKINEILLRVFLTISDHAGILYFQFVSSESGGAIVNTKLCLALFVSIPFYMCLALYPNLILLKGKYGPYSRVVNTFRKNILFATHLSFFSPILFFVFIIPLILPTPDPHENVLNRLLISASTTSEPRLIKALIKQGGNVNARDKNSRTPLMRAYQANKGVEVLKILIQRGAKVNAKDREGNTALMMYPDYRICNQICKETQKARFLLDSGASINTKNNKGRTPLMTKLNPELIKLFLDRGADINATDKDGNSALMMLSGYRGETEIVKLLLDHGADVNIKNIYGQTALIMADPRAYNRGKVRLFLKYGADVDAQDHMGRTALIMYADYYTGYRNWLEGILMLLKYGANVNIKDNEGNTALMKFLPHEVNNHARRILLEHGALSDDHLIN